MGSNARKWNGEIIEFNIPHSTKGLDPCLPLSGRSALIGSRPPLTFVNFKWVKRYGLLQLLHVNNAVNDSLSQSFLIFIVTSIGLRTKN